MARCGLAFNQRDTPPLSSERDRSGTACHSTTDDENFVLQSFPSEYWIFNQLVADSIFSRRLEPCSARHSVQIVILKSVVRWLDGGVQGVRTRYLMSRNYF